MKKVKFIIIIVSIFGALGIYMGLNPQPKILSLINMDNIEALAAAEGGSSGTYDTMYEVTKTWEEWSPVSGTNGLLCLVIEYKAKYVDCRGFGTIDCIPQLAGFESVKDKGFCQCR